MINNEAQCQQIVPKNKNVAMKNKNPCCCYLEIKFFSVLKIDVMGSRMISENSVKKMN